MRQTREETLTQPATGPKSEQTATGVSRRRGTDFVWGREGSVFEGTACPGCGALSQELGNWHQGREGRQKRRLGCEAEVRLLAWKAKIRATVGSLRKVSGSIAENRAEGQRGASEQWEGSYNSSRGRLSKNKPMLISADTLAL